MSAQSIAPIIFLAALMCGAVLVTGNAWLAPLAPIAAIGGVIAWRYPAASIAAVIALVPFAVIREFSDQSMASLSKIAGAAGLVLAGAHFLLGKRPLSHLRSNLWLPIAGLVGAYLIAFAFFLTGPEPDALRSIRQLLTAISIFFLVLAFRDQIKITSSAILIVTAVTIPCILSLFIDTGNIENSRTEGLLNDPNFFAMLIVMALPLTVALLAMARGRAAQFALGGAGLVQLFTLLQTGSRSGLVVLAFIAAMASPFLLRAFRQVNRAGQFGLIIGAAGMLAIASLTAPADLTERVERMVEYAASNGGVADRSLSRRGSYLSVGLDMAQRSPIFGLGPASFQSEYAKSGYAVAYASSVERNAFRRRAHNTYLELVAETGIVGAGAFMAIIVMALANFRYVMKSASDAGDRETGRFAAAYFLSLLGAAFFLLFISDQTHKFVWALAALSVIWRQRIAAVSAGR